MSMNKGPKITIKFFLKKSLPHGTDEKGNRLYPLYIMVTYKRKNTQIKSQYGEHYYTRMEDVEKFTKGVIPFEENILHKVMEYENEQAGEDNFSLVGLGKKYNYYTRSIYWAIETYIKELLWKAIQRTKDELQMVLKHHTAQATFTRLYKASNLLFRDFNKNLSQELTKEIKAYQGFLKIYPEIHFIYDFPTIIDWVNGGLRKDLNSVFKKNKKDMEAILSLVKVACEKYAEQPD